MPPRRSTPPSAITPASAAAPEVLDDLDRRVLDFERAAWRLEIPKDRAIRDTFGFSTTRYHQLLHRAVDDPAALTYDPMLVRRLRRLRSLRRKRRTAQRLGITL
ncbi:MAG TPA: DUF3263 domain-containing protein [Actinomycetota bacterium]|nr:DUF3263 domain-containing protein [Actinomycetota bacterium]